jgi:serine/threonine-protein kinase HipA
MRAAALAGLPTAEVFYEPHTEACVVRRFDRQVRADGTLARRVQYDLCQLAGTVSDCKYEKEGGPGLVACAELIRRYSAQPAADLRHLVRWLFFNLYVGNHDSHAKNLSVYSVPGQGVSLTPFYDLMCTRLYPGLSAEFAFAIGGEARPGELGAEHLALMSRQLGMQPRFLARQAGDMADRLPMAIDQAAREIAPALTPSAHTLAERLVRFVSSNTRKLAARITATPPKT